MFLRRVRVQRVAERLVLFEAAVDFGGPQDVEPVALLDERRVVGKYLDAGEGLRYAGQRGCARLLLSRARARGVGGLPCWSNAAGC